MRTNFDTSNLIALALQRLQKRPKERFEIIQKLHEISEVSLYGPINNIHRKAHLILSEAKRKNSSEYKRILTIVYKNNGDELFQDTIKYIEEYKKPKGRLFPINSSVPPLIRITEPEEKKQDTYPQRIIEVPLSRPGYSREI